MIWWIVLGIGGPISLYFLVRLIFSAIFLSYYEQKTKFIKQFMERKGEQNA